MTPISRRIRSLPPGHSVVTMRVVAQPGGERAERDRQVGGIDAQAGQRAAGTQHAQRDSNVLWVPSASIATSTPRPLVRRMISATGSTCWKFTT